MNRWTMVAIIALSFCFPADMLRAETRWTPSVNFSTVKDDNILFSRTDKVDDYIYLLEPGIRYTYDQELTDFTATGHVKIRRYQDDDNLDDEIYRLRLVGDTEFTERFNLKGRYEFISDTTLDSELEEIGRIFTREDRISHNAGLSPSFSLNERTSISLSGGYRSVAYDADANVDYSTWNVSLPVRWRLATQVDTIYINPGYSYRDSDTNESNTYSFRIGWDHRTTERLTFNFSVGARYTELEQVRPGGATEKTENWNGLGNLELDYKFEIGRLNIEFEHDLRNTADGDQVNVSRVIVNLRWHLTERIGLDLNGRYYYTQSEDENDDDTSDFIQAGSEIFYKFTNNHEIFIAYDYSQDDKKDIENAPRAERNRIWAGIKLNFPM